MRLIETAPAKLNLALHVRKRLDDGHHALETIFAFVEVGDNLAVSMADELSLSISGPMAAALSSGEDNLVVRAARLLAGHAEIEPRGAIELIKNLPVASGIGGGSADAAAVMRLLNRFWKLDLPLAKLAALGTRLGADIAACIWSRPMRGEGRGELVSPVDLGDLSAAPVLLINPRVPVPTGPVFKGWDGVDRGSLAKDISIDTLRASRNDLELPALRLAPEIGEVLTLLEDCNDVVLARMSGSGATCFAIFSDVEACHAAAEDLARERPQWWVMPTRFNHSL